MLTPLATQCKVTSKHTPVHQFLAEHGLRASNTDADSNDSKLWTCDRNRSYKSQIDYILHNEGAAGISVARYVHIYIGNRFPSPNISHFVDTSLCRLPCQGLQPILLCRMLGGLLKAPAIYTHTNHKPLQSEHAPCQRKQPSPTNLEAQSADERRKH